MGWAASSDVAKLMQSKDSNLLRVRGCVIVHWIQQPSTAQTMGAKHSSSSGAADKANAAADAHAEPATAHTGTEPTSSSSLPTAAASSAVSSSGYPSLLPGSRAVPPSSNPFWYDALPPTQLWQQHLSQLVRCDPVGPMQLVSGAATSEDAAASAPTSAPVALPPKPAGHLRFVCISDTHNYHSRLPLPPLVDAQIDVLVHAGDWSNVGEQADVDRFTAWIRALPIPYKVVIAGNHDLSFDEVMYLPHLHRNFRHKSVVDTRAAKAALVAGYDHAAATPSDPFPAFAPGGGVAYLEDSGISISGVRIWGSPWQPEFYNWAFNLPTGAPLREKWKLIPTETDVLVTHGPPLGHGDMCLPARNRAGCADLLLEVTTRIRPHCHVFGHIHEGYGQTSDGTTHFINASNCNLRYDPNNLNPPIVIDVPIPTATHGQAEQS